MHQLLTLVPRHHFNKLAAGLDSDRYVKTFTSWNQFSTLLYAQAGGSLYISDNLSFRLYTPEENNWFIPVFSFSETGVWKYAPAALRETETAEGRRIYGEEQRR
ncbi:MAG: DUF4372 domain-containing protein [Elusimicrobia bacterium]|nr:DUF4372 domain-containing protein [Elusimicrobiota bacterium]